MSTSNINIAPQNVSGRCDLKCAYNFKYNKSNSTATNNGVMISLTYENSNEAPVMFNNNKYTVSNIFITCPSIHTFNGSVASAEIVIEHTPSLGGPQLNVAVPITLSSESSTASNIITQIIQTVSSNAPSEGNTTNLNLTDFTLQDIVPNKPYFNYADSNNTEWIVFGILQAIPLNTSTLTTLSQIIQPYALPTPGNSLFLNKSGPNTTGAIGDGIYISCKPTGSSKEESAVEYSKNTSSYDLFNNPTSSIIFQILIGCIVFICVFALISYGYSFITNDSPKLLSIPKLSIPKINI